MIVFESVYSFLNDFLSKIKLEIYCIVFVIVS